MQGILVEGSSKTSEVMMLTDTIELEVLAIKPEASLCIKLEIAESCSGLIGVYHLATNRHFRVYLIYIGCLTTPEHRLADRDGRLCTLGFTNHFTIGSDKGICHSGVRILCDIVNRHLDVKFSFTLNYPGIGKYAPMLYMDGVCLSEPYMAIYTAATIPTGIRLIGVVYLHRHDISSLFQIFRDIILEAGISIRAESHLLTIHKYR